jgi:DNA-binding NtrC family response regulator
MVGALILHGVDALVHADQRRLLDWLGDALAVKVISTAPAPLLPRIERGAFLDSLYYRLNTICILMMGAEEWHSA